MRCLLKSSVFGRGHLIFGRNPMLQHPVIKAKYSVIPVNGEGIYLIGENEKHVLEGDTMMHMVPLLNGQNSWHAIMSRLSPVIGLSLIHI